MKKNMDQLLRWKWKCFISKLFLQTTTWSRIFRKEIIDFRKSVRWIKPGFACFLCLAVDSGGTWSQDWCGKTGHGNSTFGRPYRYLLLGSSVFCEKNTSHDDWGDHGGWCMELPTRKSHIDLVFVKDDGSVTPTFCLSKVLKTSLVTAFG